MQKAVALVADMQASNNARIESGKRGVSVEALDSIAFFWEESIFKRLFFGLLGWSWNWRI